MVNPVFTPPMLPTLVANPPAGEGWIHEIKHDGFRTQLAIGPEGSRAYTRNGHDWSHLYAPLLREAERLGRTLLVDGEVVLQDELGHSDFDGLSAAIRNEPESLAFFAFDLLWLDGASVRDKPLSRRKQLLQDVLGDPDPSRRIQYVSHTDTAGPKFFELICELGLEGVVSKRLTSRYRSGRTRSWLKTKNFVESEFVVFGWDVSPDGPAFALLARHDQEHLEYAGSAFVTLAEPDRSQFWHAMHALARVAPAVPRSPHVANWVTPELRVRARHLHCSGKLRHATIGALI